MFHDMILFLIVRLCPFSLLTHTTSWHKRIPRSRSWRHELHAIKQVTLFSSWLHKPSCTPNHMLTPRCLSNRSMCKSFPLR
jgi:hypothetical protein